MNDSGQRASRPDNMNAIVYERYGPPEVLHVREVEAPRPAEDELLIRVHAAEATKADCELRRFRFPVQWFWLPLRLASGLRAPRRKILGGYFAGQVEAVGRNVEGLSEGDEVYGSTGLRMGAYGQRMTLGSECTLVRKPDNMSYEEAAAVPLGGLNALHFMRRARIQSGDSVLINGAGGSIGAHAIQIAKAMGATVVGVDASHKKAFVLGLGADRFIDYAIEDFAADGAQFDVVFDMVASSSYSRCMAVLRPGGRYLVGNPRVSVMVRSLFTTWFTDKTASFAFAKETREELSTLTQMIEAGQVRPIVDRVYPMQEAAAAHRRVESEERVGAIVLSIGADD